MKSKAYWVQRAVEVETYLQSQADSVKDGVIKAYERAIKNVNNDIEKTFKAYISTDIPEKEARRLMSIADSDKQYEELLKLYAETDDKTVKKEILNRINAQAYGARISQLEGLKRNVYIYFRHVANEAIKEQKKLYDSAVKTAYYTNIFDTAKGLNCGIDFSLVPQRAVNMVLSEPWHGHNYSERVWIHNDRFIQAVGQTIEDGIISGHSVSRMTDKLIDYVKDTAPGGIRTSVETLVRSETAHFMNQGQRMAYEEIGIKQYRFVAALSELTCDTCGSLDGSVFDTDKAVEGENFPPIHPRCRCVTIMADVNLTSRIARDPLTGENYKVDGSMTFNEWKKGLSDEQRNAIDKYAKNDIIKMKGGRIMNINSIDSPIEQRNTGKGNPNGIIHIGRPLNNRQKRILESLPEYDSSTVIKKKDVNMKDLSALTAYTGDEFAVFTRKSERLIIRGNKNSVNVDIDKAKELNKQGYKWSGHTHPGISPDFATPSQGDKDILECFNQKRSVIYNSTGRYRTFEKE